MIPNRTSLNGLFLKEQNFTIIARPYIYFLSIYVSCATRDTRTTHLTYFACTKLRFLRWFLRQSLRERAPLPRSLNEGPSCLLSFFVPCVIEKTEIGALRDQLHEPLLIFLSLFSSDEPTWFYQSSLYLNATSIEGLGKKILDNIQTISKH